RVVLALVGLADIDLAVVVRIRPEPAVAVAVGPVLDVRLPDGEGLVVAERIELRPGLADPDLDEVGPGRDVRIDADRIVGDRERALVRVRHGRERVDVAGQSGRTAGR